MPAENGNKSSYTTEDDIAVPNNSIAIKVLQTFCCYIESQKNVPDEILENLRQLIME